MELGWIQRAILVTRIFILMPLLGSLPQDSVLLKLPELVGLTAKASMLSKLPCVVTLPLATVLLTVLVVSLILALK